MTRIEVTCQSCEKKLKAKPEAIGQSVKCPKCGEQTKIEESFNDLPQDWLAEIDSKQFKPTEPKTQPILAKPKPPQHTGLIVCSLLLKIAAVGCFVAWAGLLVLTLSTSILAQSGAGLMLGIMFAGASLIGIVPVSLACWSAGELIMLFIQIERNTRCSADLVPSSLPAAAHATPMR